MGRGKMQVSLEIVGQSKIRYQPIQRSPQNQTSDYCRRKKSAADIEVQVDFAARDNSLHLRGAYPSVGPTVAVGGYRDAAVGQLPQNFPPLRFVLADETHRDVLRQTARLEQAGVAGPLGKNDVRVAAPAGPIHRLVVSCDGVVEVRRPAAGVIEEPP